MVGDSSGLTKEAGCQLWSRTALQWLLLLTIYNQSHNQKATLKG